MPERSEATRRGRSMPARTPEDREDELIVLAYEAVEEKIRNRTATSQELTHFLRLGSTRERLEQQRIRHENELLRVRSEALQAQERSEVMYAEALRAMSTYSGRSSSAEEDYD